MIRLKLDQIINRKYEDGVSYRKLAKEIGITHLPLWKMAKGKPYNPSLDMLDKLCKFFDCDVGELLEFKRDNKKRK